MSVLSVWAHYDDDLIFGCPTIDRAVAAGEHVTTLFLTAADAGRDAAYVAEREEGLRRAYAVMHGAPLEWRPVEVGLAGAIATGWVAASAPIELLSLRLPDGRPNGTGFATTGNVSLRRLLEGEIDAIPPLDGAGPALDADALVAALEAALRRHPDAEDAATRLLAHAPRVGGVLTERDHSDHWATGAFLARAAAGVGIAEDRISWRIGYPSSLLPATLDGDALARKVEVFRAYAAHDAVVARPDAEGTLALPGFGEWLRREYALSGGEPVAVA